MSRFFLSAPEQRYVLATLVARDGNSYRQPGACMLIREDDTFVGCISGGCLEAEVVKSAREVLLNKKPLCLQFDTQLHFGCAGVITVFLEPLLAEKETLFRQIDDALSNRKTFHLVTNWDCADSAWGTAFSDIEPSANTEKSFSRKIEKCPRVILLGGGVDTDPFRKLAMEMGWQIAGEQGESDALSCASSDAPESILERFPADDRTAVVLMNHHFARDLAFLKTLLPAGYAYVGLLGSRRRKEEILNQIDDPEFFANPAIFERFYAPAGHHLGGRDPMGVALSIVSEIQAVLHRCEGGSLRDKSNGPSTFETQNRLSYGIKN